MKIKSIYAYMKEHVVQTLDGSPLDLLAITEGETTNKETGEISKFIRCEVEVPRGYEGLSRCRFSVKIPDGKLHVTEQDMAEKEYMVTFNGLTISYIDTKGTVYFRADNYIVKEVK